MGLALVTRIPSLMEAQIAAGALRAAGVHAEVFDATFGGMEAPVIEGLGGYRIMAPAEQVVEARQLLKAIRADPGLAAPEDGRPWSSAPAGTSGTRRRGMRWVALAVLAIPAIYWLVRTVAG